jgi:hypothetical protein
MTDNALFFKIADAEVIVPISKLTKALREISTRLSEKYSFHEYQIYTRYTKPSSGVKVYQNKTDPNWIWIGLRVLKESGKKDIEKLVDYLVEECDGKVHGAKLGRPNPKVAVPESLIDLYKNEGKSKFTLLHSKTPEIVNMEE